MIMEQFVFKNQKKLRYGITTGTCAAAAASAAAALLLLNLEKRQVQIHTPKGITVSVDVTRFESTKQRAEFYVQKDSGDDPDVTNHALIHASVEKLPQECGVSPCAFQDERYPDLYLDGGDGIGRVTRPGMEQRPGQAAINTVPRAMIFEAVAQIRTLAEYRGRLLITVRIPEGKELAKRTFNPRLGIEGGLSVLGTSGILEPMSERAIVDTIEAEIRQLHALGQKKLLVTPGNYGQGYVRDYCKLPLERSVKCSNYIGDTIDLAIAYEMEYFLLVGNVGKLCKLAAGVMNTHSRVADCRAEVFTAHAALCGGDGALLSGLMQAVSTDEMLELLRGRGLERIVVDSILQRIKVCMEHRIGGRLAFGVMLFSEKYGFLGQSAGTEEVLELFRREDV